MKTIAAIALLLASAGGAGAQTVHVFEGGKLAPIDCKQLSARIGSAASRTTCYEPRSGPKLRCEEVGSEQAAAFCERIGRDGGGGGVASRLAALGNDLTTGFTRPGGRRAGEDACPPGLPEGELLAGDDTLLFAAPEATDLQLADERGAAAGGGGAQVSAASESLRGRHWQLRGRQGGRGFVCKFTVLSAAEARPLVQQLQSMPAGSRAGLLERAAFYRANSFWYEYWKTIDALRRP